MSCCNDSPQATPTEYDDPFTRRQMLLALPESTMCCFAKMTYSLATAAAAVFGQGRRDWEELTDDDRVQVVKTLKSLIASDIVPDDSFERLLHAFVRRLSNIG